MPVPVSHPTLDEHWAEFKQAVIPPNAVPSQVKAMKWAYMSGAVALISVQADCLAGKISRDEVDAMLKRLWEELNDFRTKGIGK